MDVARRRMDVAGHLHLHRNLARARDPRRSGNLLTSGSRRQKQYEREGNDGGCPSDHAASRTGALGGRTVAPRKSPRSGRRLWSA